MTQSQPPITGTTHALPFDKLSPRDFERLCLWLVEREGYERAEHLGAAGSEQGRDIVAWREGALWAFQSKRVRRFGPQDALAEVEKVLTLPEAERPAGLIFLVTCDVSANTRQVALARCAREMECHFWAGTDLDEKVKRHTDILEEFFADSQSRTETTVSATVSYVTDSTVITAGRGAIIYEDTKPISTGDLLDACRAQVEGVLYDLRHKYDPKLYVNRAIEHELNEFFDTPLAGPAPNCFLIVAPAGSGQTNLLCDVARIRVTQQPVLLLMGGNIYLGATTGLLGAIQSELEAASSQIAFRSAGDSLHTLHRLAEELDQDALLMLDAINEHDRPAQMRRAIEDLIRRTRGRRIKLVITCRDYYWGLFKGRFWEGATVNDLPAEVDEDEVGDIERDFSRFAADEHERALGLYLEHYAITGRPVGDAAEQCRHPLLLRFFCEAYHGQDIGEVEGIRLKELFDHYWNQKLNSIAERMIQHGDERLQDGLTATVGGYLLAIAAYMLHHNMRAIPLAEIPKATGYEEQHDDPHSIYGRIRDEFIILEETERGKGRRGVVQVAFVYEEFMEYVMARSLMRDWDRANLDEATILIEIEKLTGKYEQFAQIIGVVVYLALMLKKERGLELWSLLLNRGERWQKVVFEAFRKLPEDQLDLGMFNALGEMLTTNDESVQMQVLDTLKVKRVGQAAPASMVDIVCELTTHEQEAIRRRAVLALGNISEAGLVLPALIRAADDPRKSVRENAITALIRLEDPGAVEPLISALKYSDNKEVRVRAAKALGDLGDTRAVEPLIATLKDIDKRVWRSAVEALKKLGDARAVEPLIAALKDSDEWVRRSAVEALGELGDTRAVEPLITALKDSDWGVQSGAAEALGKLGDTQAEAPLIAALKDSDRRVRSKAAEALEMLQSRRFSLIAAAQRFFESAGFEWTPADREAHFLCQPQDRVWQRKFSKPIAVEVVSESPLDGEKVRALCQTVQQDADTLPVIIVVVDRAPTDSGWLQICTMRAEDVQVIPMDDRLLSEGEEQARQRQVLERHLRRFLGHEQDLYNVRHPVADRLNFFGREALANELMEHLFEGRPLALFGLRKMGKSSLLMYLRDKLPFATARVDLQSGVELSGLYERILTSWSRSMRVKVRELDWSPTNLDGSANLSAAFTAATRHLLTLLEAHSVPPRLCLLVDEADLIVPKDSEGLDRYLDFARALRGLVQEEAGRFSLLMAGVDPIFNRVNRLAGQQNPFYQFFREIYLPSLERGDCIQMIRNIGRQMGLVYSDEAVAFVADVSGGHPFLARQLCSLAFQQLDRSGEVALFHLQETAKRFIREPGTAELLDENGLWGEISSPDLWPQLQVIENQTVLKSLAQAEPQPESDLVRQAQDRRACERSLDELERRAVLGKLERSLYNIHLRLFRSWIRRYQLGME